MPTERKYCSRLSAVRRGRAGENAAPYSGAVRLMDWRNGSSHLRSFGFFTAQKWRLIGELARKISKFPKKWRVMQNFGAKQKNDGA